MRRLALVALFAVACGAVPAHAQTLALAYQQGNVYKYRLHMTGTEKITSAFTSPPNPDLSSEITAQEMATVKSVDAGGVADLSIALSNIFTKSQINGGVTSSTTEPILPAEEVKIAADGRILSINGKSTGGWTPFGVPVYSGELVSAVLADTPVKPGDIWSKNYDTTNPGFGSGAIHVTAKSKYLRDESFQGVNAAVIETKSDATLDLTIDMSKLVPPISGIQMTTRWTKTFDVTTWIDPSGHSILKSHVTSKSAWNTTYIAAPGATMPGTIGPMSQKGDDTIDLLPA